MQYCLFLTWVCFAYVARRILLLLTGGCILEYARPPPRNRSHPDTLTNRVPCYIYGPSDLFPAPVTRTTAALRVLSLQVDLVDGTFSRMLDPDNTGVCFTSVRKAYCIHSLSLALFSEHAGRPLPTPRPIRPVSNGNCAPTSSLQPYMGGSERRRE